MTPENPHPMTRPAAWAQSFYPLANGGEPAILFCFIYLYLAAAGGGAWSLDRMRNKA